MAAMGQRIAVGLGAAAAAGLWLGCNAILGIEAPEHEPAGQEPPDLCAGVQCAPLDACHEAGACDPATGQCSNPAAPDGTACDDGSACTQADACQGGTCVGADPVVCPEAGGCQTGCDPATGLCGAPDGTACDDGSVCTSTDTCQGGVCNPGADATWAHWAPPAAKQYVVTDGVVVDTVTGKTWQRVVPEQEFTHAEALAYCGALSLPGYPSGWRLPTRIELVSIVDYTQKDPAIDKMAFPDTPSEAFWSSSLYAGDSSLAWHVYFDDGNVNYYHVDGTFRVRCVR